MNDGQKWKLVPEYGVTDEMVAAFRSVVAVTNKGTIIGLKHGLAEAIAVAPPAPAVSVTDAIAAQVELAYVDSGDHGRSMIAAVQSVLGHTLGLVSREEMARAVEAAFKEGANLGIDDDAWAEKQWENSDARKALRSGG